MITLKSTYENRRNEIKKFTELLQFLEKRKMSVNEDEVSFEEFFYSEEDEIKLSYSELINILKSNLSLMIYNLIEYTVSGLVDCIYYEIWRQQLSYVDVNESIRNLWRKTILKAAKDPGANFNTFIKKNEEIIDAIMSKLPLNIKARDSLPAGNLDGVSIKKTFKSHGYDIQTNSDNFRPDILESIKNNRNQLAHGAVSFVDAVRDDSIQDFCKYTEFIILFLQELIDGVEEYIKEEKFKI
nr:MAE_28990/MAE_18760 family HEPN-like nuclease [uncultured Anaerostipes sp.]